MDTKLTNDIETTRNNFRALDRRMDRLEADVKALMVHLGVEPGGRGVTPITGLHHQEAPAMTDASVCSEVEGGSFTMLPDNTFNAITQRIPVLRDRLATEEATKQALVLPFLQALGYNVFDPTEVEPEYTADIGTKQGEKVDYAVMADGKPVILIECKKVSDTTLDRNVSQLLRYFGTTSAHIGVLTNGIVYQFFSDLESPNVMDTTPFLEINMEYLDSRIVEQLGQFAKGFDLEETVEAASRLRYVNGMKQALEQQYQQPEDDFVEWLGRRVYTGRMTQSVKEKFVSLTRRAMREFVNNHISDTLKAAQDLTYIPETLQEAVIEEGVRAAGEVVTTPLGTGSL